MDGWMDGWEGKQVVVGVILGYVLCFALLSSVQYPYFLIFPFPPSPRHRNSTISIPTLPTQTHLRIKQSNSQPNQEMYLPLSPSARPPSLHNISRVPPPCSSCMSIPVKKDETVPRPPQSVPLFPS
ncbi:hypothetical protein IQ07DRAFT_295116 [Pyrenochaeta sp. DS3sAY3a]|nr:hypothetical protein IQ07DRAFT_295116 [Pyrenochaeta sp. DS3sAY3a]